MSVPDPLVPAYFKARSCSDADLAVAEKRLVEEPDDLVARATILGARLSRDLRAYILSAEFAEHLLWIARNAPWTSLWLRVGDFVHPSGQFALHEQLQTIWEKHATTENASLGVLRNAASFFRTSVPSRAMELLEKGAKREPNNRDWPFQIGMLLWGRAQVHGRKLPDEPDRLLETLFDAEKAREALLWFDKAEALLSRGESPEWINIAQINAAIGCGDWQRVDEISQALLDEKRRAWQVPFTGNVVFTANRALGISALRKGDVEKAKGHLLASARSVGSPQLSSFGPNMTLALALLARGEREVVLQFLDACSAFWKLDRGQLATWRAVIQRGEVPDFGAHLYVG